MATWFKTLRKEMLPERRKRNQLRTELMIFAMTLDEIRYKKRSGGK